LFWVGFSLIFLAAAFSVLALKRPVLAWFADGVQEQRYQRQALCVVRAYLSGALLAQVLDLQAFVGPQPRLSRSDAFSLSPFSPVRLCVLSVGVGTRLQVQQFHCLFLLQAHEHRIQ
jgi:hypothetical protein